VLGCVTVEVGALGEVLAQQPIAVLIAPTLPRRVGIAEVDRRTEVRRRKKQRRKCGYRVAAKIDQNRLSTLTRLRRVAGPCQYWLHSRAGGASSADESLAASAQPAPWITLCQKGFCRKRRSVRCRGGRVGDLAHGFAEDLTSTRVTGEAIDGRPSPVSERGPTPPTASPEIVLVVTG
jgi:hypothetical protein